MNWRRSGEGGKGEGEGEDEALWRKTVMKDGGKGSCFNCWKKVSTNQISMKLERRWTWRSCEWSGTRHRPTRMTLFGVFWPVFLGNLQIGAGRWLGKNRTEHETQRQSVILKNWDKEMRKMWMKERGACTSPRKDASVVTAAACSWIWLDFVFTCFSGEKGNFNVSRKDIHGVT